MAPELLLVLVALGMGYLARLTKRLTPEAADPLNRFVIDLCLPAMILRIVPELQMRWDLLALVATPWLLACVAGVLALAAQRMWRLDRATSCALFVCTALGNTSFLGFPLCSALLGSESLPLAAVYDQLGSFLLLCTLAPLAIARASGAKSPTFPELARRVVSFPPFVALLLGLIPIAHPPWLDSVLERIAAALVPTAMFAVGLRLRVTPPAETRAFAFALIVKLGVMPLCALLLARALSAAPDVVAVAVVESAMPTMITAGALLMAAGLAPQLTASLVGWGIVLAQLTVPAWAYVAQRPAG